MKEDLTESNWVPAGDELNVERAGHFRIYLGSAAGVGKTYAMLNEGRRRAGRGTDVVVGFVETHGRPHTQEAVEGLEVVPRKKCEYRGSEFEEMDVQAVIDRKPVLALIDELAHTNVPGCGGNEKRWQDIQEILAAGIDVITTVNIQHVESIADAVEESTGIKVRERVPDRVVRSADQIELVDSSPEQLRRRMLHGNIYPMEKVQSALHNFFRTENLFALRELALRYLADETELNLMAKLDESERGRKWETTERLMVALLGGRNDEQLLTRSSRIAQRLKANMDVVYLPRSATETAKAKKRMEDSKKAAEELGARWYEFDGDDRVDRLLAQAKESMVTQLVVGDTRSQWTVKIFGLDFERLRVIRRAIAEGIDILIPSDIREMS